MSTSSAVPDDLSTFVSRGDAARTEVDRGLTSLYATYDAHGLGSGEFGMTLDRGGSRLTQLFAGTEDFVAAVRDAFIRAGVTGGMRGTVLDRDIAAQLAANGVSPRLGPVTFEDPIGWGIPPSSGWTNDPVCTSNGNFVAVETDLELPGRARVMSWTRTYNSRAHAREGAFGRGWSSFADVSLIETRDGGCVFRGPDGSETMLRPDEPVRRGDRGARLVLATHENGWTVTTGPDSRWFFRADGSPARWSTPDSDVEFEYESGRLHLMRERRSERTIMLAWNGPRIASVESGDGREVAYEYADGDCRKVLSPTGSKRRYDVDAGLVERIVDADGVVEVVNEYDADGRVVEQESPFGRRVRFRYLTGYRTVVTDDEGGLDNVFVHDLSGNVVGARDGRGYEFRRFHDERGLVAGWIDRDGTRWDVAHDDNGNLLERRGPEGWSETYRWDELSRLVAATTPAGTCTWSYEGRNRTPSMMVDETGAETRVVVDRDDQIETIVDADGVRASYEWNADGAPVSVTNGVDGKTTLAYDPAGNMTSCTGPTGRIVQFSNDLAGRLTGVKTAVGESRYEWSTAGRALGERDANGPRWTNVFGSHGALESLADATGAAIRLTYDMRGNLASLVSPDGREFLQEHDAAGQLAEVSDPTGAAWRYSYTATGHAIAVEQPDGAIVRREVDGLGRTVREIDAAGHVTYRSYATSGALEWIRDDAAGTVIRLVHDPAGRLTRIERRREDRDVTEWTDLIWTAGGRISSLTDADGEVTLRYDADGRVTEIEGDDTTRRYEYDAAGAVTSAEVSGGQVEITRDAAGRVAAVRRARGGTFSFTFDAAGRLTSLADGEGRVRHYEWDPRDLLLAATDGLGARTTWVYDEAGRAATRTDPLGGVTEFAYDEAGRLAETTDPLRRRSSIERDVRGFAHAMRFDDGSGWRAWLDASGVVTGFGDIAAAGPSIPVDAAPYVPREANGTPPKASVVLDAGGHVVAGPGGRYFRHDAAGQLVEAGGPDGRALYSYDAGGRLVEEESADGTRVVYRYDAAAQLEQRSEDGGRRITYDYDSAGRRTNEKTTDGEEVRYGWDAIGRLVSIDHSDGPSFEIAYDAQGRPRSVNDTVLGWDDGLLPELTRVGAARYARDEENRLWMEDEAGRREVPLDWLGTPGATVDVWGRTEGTGVAMGFRGALAIGGVVWFGARPYHPETRSFLAPDPLPHVPGAPAAGNPYQYAFNDPVTFVDPFGLRPLSQAEFEAWKSSLREGAFEKAWEAMANDPWDTLAMGLVVVAGVGLLFVPGGQAIGVGILSGAVFQAGWGLATGTFSPRSVAIAGVAGGVGGAVTDAVKGLAIVNSRRGFVVAETVGGAADAATEMGLSGEPWSWPRFFGEAGVSGLSQGGLRKLTGAIRVNGLHLTPDRLEKVLVRHAHSSDAINAGKYLDMPEPELKSMIEETVRYGKARPNTRGRAGTIYKLKFPQKVGTDVKGAPTAHHRVVVLPDGTLKTAFPDLP